MDFRSGKVGFVRMEFGARIFQNAIMRYEMESESILQRFKS
jgi:hypothetical protein